jgi:hypothetical protein
MANINYRSITPTVIAAAVKKPGHSDTVLFAPTSAFTLIAKPTAPFVNPGDTKKITADHTFPVNEGFRTFQCKSKTVDPTGDASGEAGGQVPLYKWKCIIKGDSAHINEFVENLLNEDIIALFNDPVCGVDDYVQAGSSCTPAEITGFAFRGGTKGAGGVKEYEFTVQSSDKFYYSGTVTMASEDPTLDAPGLLSISAVTDDGFVVNWADVTDATGYDITVATNAGFTTGLVNYDRAVSDVTVSGLDAATVYFIRVRAKATGFNSSSYTSFSITTLA